MTHDLPRFFPEPLFNKDAAAIMVKPPLDERRRFYKHVAREGEYGKLERLPKGYWCPRSFAIGEHEYYRNSRTGWGDRGLPVWGRRSAVEKNWTDDRRVKRGIVYAQLAKKLQTAADRMTGLMDMLEARRREMILPVYRKLFPGLMGIEIPNDVLLLGADFLKLKLLLKQKKGGEKDQNGKRTKRNTQRSNRKS